MGFIANSFSMSQYRIAGDIDSKELYSFLSEGLSSHQFKSIDNTLDEISAGWVTTFDSMSSDFSSPSAFWFDRYALFSLRVDQRKIPGQLFRQYLKAAETEFLSSNPRLQRVPKQKKNELKDTVKLALLSKTLPVPSTIDLLWDTETGTVTIFSLSSKSIEQVETVFKKSFEGIRLVPIYPFARAESLISPEKLEALKKLNKSATESVLDQIRSNSWLGSEFLLWLLYMCSNGRVSYSESAVSGGEDFTSFVNDRFVLLASSEEGVQKITVSGSHNHFAETVSALRYGKSIIESTISIEQKENLWKVTLKGETFMFGSLKSPSVVIDTDLPDDPLAERESFIYEKIMLLKKFISLFDSLLLTYLDERVSEKWVERTALIAKWIEDYRK